MWRRRLIRHRNTLCVDSKQRGRWRGVLYRTSPCWETTELTLSMRHHMVGYCSICTGSLGIDRAVTTCAWSCPQVPMMRRFKSSVKAQQARSKSTFSISLTLGTPLIALPSLHVELIHDLKFRHWALPALSRKLIPYAW